MLPPSTLPLYFSFDFTLSDQPTKKHDSEQARSCPSSRKSDEEKHHHIQIQSVPDTTTTMSSTTPKHLS